GLARFGRVAQNSFSACGIIKTFRPKDLSESHDFRNVGTQRLDVPEFFGFGFRHPLMIPGPHRVGVGVTALQHEFVDILVHGEPIAAETMPGTLLNPLLDTHRLVTGAMFGMTHVRRPGCYRTYHISSPSLILEQPRD